ncbi:NADH-quinone oxidoreductase subunit C [Metabacillus herbersteinensis]|uniref:NAD(P)H dehydrogenase subunit J n=1 Tax=Metabacillus herbersteinensis TaxID=283816 RepID=A0ABV6GGE8_9BACI
MSDELDLAKKKAAAAAKAKAAALAKQKAKETGEVTSEEDKELAKKKATAAAKAKAAALAKQKAKETGEATSEEDKELAKKKAVAVAKAKGAAAAKAKMSAQSQENKSEDELAKEKAKAIAIAKAKAAAAAKAKAANVEGVTQLDETAVKPSRNQPLLNTYVKVIGDHLGDQALEDAYINGLSKDVPTLIATKDSYFKVAQYLKFNEQLSFDYLSELHGSDFETHMEIYLHLYSYKNKQSVALKVKIDRDQPEIQTVQPLWEGANWPEREAFDLLGIKFSGHPKLERIMLPDDWVGYPLRKDYEPYDVEV